MAKKKGKKEKKKAKKAAKKAAKEAAKAAKAAMATKQATPSAPRKATRKAAPKPARKAKKAQKRAAKKAAKPAKLVDRRRHQDRSQPESLRLRSAGPSFTVNDLQKSLAFYRDVLGFTPRERWEEGGVLQGIELVAGSVTFWLGQDDWKKGRDRVKGEAFRMYCSTAQDIDALAARVKAGGGTIVDGPKDEPWGGRAFAVRDYDGFTITFANGG
jgi:catechol 2,3-dioxygenase-like lactoylglutathione lyase family enzyme